MSNSKDIHIKTVEDFVNMYKNHLANSSDITDRITLNIYIDNDIDFNSNSKYFIYNDYINITFEKEHTINIYGQNHKILNMYKTDNTLFCIRWASSNAVSLNIYDLDFEIILNKNPIETSQAIKFSLTTGINIQTTVNMQYNNCTFRVKLFNSLPKSANFTALFDNGQNQYFKLKFNNCIFNIDYYNFNIPTNNTNNANMYLFYSIYNDGIILNYSQVYLKIYMLDNSTTTDRSLYLINDISLNNSFIIVEYEKCNSKQKIVFNNMLLSNSYFLFKTKDKTNFTSDTSSPAITLNINFGSTGNNWYDSQLATECGIIVNFSPGSNNYCKGITTEQAKDVDYLMEEVGFIISK